MVIVMFKYAEKVERANPLPYQFRQRLYNVSFVVRSVQCQYNRRFHAK